MYDSVYAHFGVSDNTKVKDTCANRKGCGREVRGKDENRRVHVKCYSKTERVQCMMRASETKRNNQSTGNIGATHLDKDLPGRGNELSQKADNHVRAAQGGTGRDE